VEARVAVVALASTEHGGAVAQLDLGPRHQSLEPYTLAALVQMAAKANRANNRGLGLYLDGFG